jgi:hypothetical protein
LDWNWSADVNGGQPVLVSPQMIETEKTDYNKLYRLILGELEEMGISWKTEARDRVEKKIKIPPTPLIRLSDNKEVRVLVKHGMSVLNGLDLPATDVPAVDNEIAPEIDESEEFSDNDDEEAEDNE